MALAARAAVSPSECPLAAPSLVDEVAKLVVRAAWFSEWVSMAFFMSNGLCNIAGMDADLGKEVVVAVELFWSVADNCDLG